MTLTFRAVEDGDLDMLAAWHRRPHILQWWPDPPPVYELQEYCSSDAIPADGAQFCLALLDNLEPVGFIQSYRAVACHKDGWWLDETNPGVFGIDQFLANAGQLNQGLGTQMVQAYVDRLFVDPAVSHIQSDPDPRNHRAIRSLEKAGFRPVREINTPDGSSLLMYRHR